MFVFFESMPFIITFTLPLKTNTMKKLIFPLVAILLLNGACTDENQDIEVINPLAATKWKAPDPIADLLYGGENNIFYEFINESEATYYGLKSGTVRNVAACTYTFEGQTISIIKEGQEYIFTLSGSFLTSETQVVPDGSNDPLIFVKE